MNDIRQGRLSKQGEVADIGDAERLRLNFHLRQFVDAMSPALLLAFNPVALRRAFETGGTSLADGMRNQKRDYAVLRLHVHDVVFVDPFQMSRAERQMAA